MNKETIKDFVIGLCFVLSEVLIFQHLSLFEAYPDPLLIFLLWLALRYQRMQLIIFAGVLALFQDILFDYWGLNMFAKVLMCFVSYNFINKNTEGRLLIGQVFLTIAAASIFHNVVFVGLSSFVDAYATGFSPLIFVIGKSLYTATLGTMLFIFRGN